MRADLAARLARLTGTQRALLARRLGVEPAAGAEPVAIVGMGCRLPGGVESPGDLWAALREGRDLVGEVPRDRWDLADWYDADPAAPGAMNSRRGAFLDDVAGFDRRFFGVPEDEASRMDPQQRLLLETAYAALEDAGIPAGSLAGSRTGVYTASMTDDYAWMQSADPAAVTGYTGVGTQRSILANRLSYQWDLRGPSLALDTACSSSLVAIHLACQSLRAGESDLAVAGGVNVMLTPVTSVIYAKLGMLAPDGRCKTFDARADGFVRGEGCGVVVLKRLQDALRDGDPVWAVVRGSATGQDGRTSGITVPNGPAQTDVVRRALAQAGAGPAEVGLVETHGTGTALGDPLELEALAAALGPGAPRLLGAVKTNLGHLEAAAGVVGVIKTALALTHREVPPVLHQEALNPRIDLDAGSFVIPTSVTAFPGGLAGVSSFGFGGSLAHAVLAPAPPRAEREPDADGPRLVAVTARVPEAVADLAAAYAAELDAGASLADVSATTLRRRDHHPYRAAVVAESAREAADALRSVAAGPRTAKNAAAGFLFPGQSALRPGTAARLFEQSPVFRATVLECDAAFQAELGWTPSSALAGGAGTLDTRHGQALLFTVQAGLTALWRSFGVVPGAVVGQSLGEVAAAHAAGVLGLEDAVRVVAARGRAMAPLQGRGATAVVELPEREAAGLGLTVAGVLGPTTTLVSGDPEPVRRAVERLAAGGVFAQELDGIRLAFHSEAMAAAVPGLVGELASLRPEHPAVPMFSTVTGRLVDGPLDAAHWGRNVADPFRLPDAVTAAAGHVTHWIEISAHPALRRPVTSATGLPVLPSLRRGRDGLRCVLETAGELLRAGVGLDAAALAPDGEAVRLPGHPWRRERSWLPSRTAPASPPPAPAAAPVPVPDPGPVVPEPDDELEPLLRRLWSEALAVDLELVTPDANFFELGGDSLKGFALVRQISEALDVRIPTEALADLLTVGDLAEHIRAQRARPVPEQEALPGPEPAPDVPPDRYEPFPLLPIQRAYWIGRELELGGVNAGHYLEYETRGLDLPRLEHAWNRLVRRHEMLRAVVDPDGRQRILAEVPYYRIELLEDADEAALTELRATLCDPPRTTADWPLFEIKATRRPDGRLRVHLGFNMLVCDGRSFAILSQEWRELYERPGAVLPEITASFRDVALAEADRPAPDPYWTGRLASLPGPPQVPWARDPAAIGRPSFHRRSLRLAREPWARLRAAAARTGVGASALLLAAYTEVLGTWSAAPAFCVNVTTFDLRGRHPDGDRLVGDFTSNVPVEVDCTAAEAFGERARLVQRRLWADLGHTGRSGVEIVAEANALRGDAVFGRGLPYVFTSLLGGDAEAPPVPFGWLGPRSHGVARTPQVVADLLVLEDSGELLVDFDTVDAIFPEGVPDAMFAALAGFLRALADGPEAWEAGPLGLTPEEGLAARRAANRTDRPLPSGGLHEPFVAHARREPDRLAVVHGPVRLDYGTLDRASEHVADELERHGVRPGDLVAVRLAKGWEQVVAVLGVLKAGAAYVPVDPDLPAERRARIIDRAGASVVLAAPGAEPEPGRTTVAVTGQEAPVRDRPRTGDSLAYVIFTSGSTGEPKGVRIRHRAALNTIADVNERFGVRAGDAVLALSSLGFDLSVYDVFGSLAAGAAIVVPQDVQDPAHWAALVEAHGVTLWNSVPALYGLYVEHLELAGATAPRTLRSVLLSGDWIPTSLPRRSEAVAPSAALTGLGGATEASIWSIAHPVGELDPAAPSVPYGRPLANQRFHVLNAAGNPCPDWVPGELLIAGAGLADGYHGDPGLTARAFPVDRRTGERRYRTGDLGRYLPDGTIEFLGRRDLQVKVQGHRIELGEIEAALLASPGVTAAAVVAVGPRDGRRALAAHVAGTAEPAALRERLARSLPGYMVPRRFRVWDALPLTANGKVDRAGLAAAPAEPVEPAGGEHPRTEVEAVLAAIWADVLGVADPGVHDDFFAHGGDSILGVRLVSRARREGIGLTPREVFDHPTIAALAAVARTAAPVAHAAPEPGEVPLSTAQRWFFALDLADPAHFHQTLRLVPRHGPLDPSRLAAALSAVAARHDVFRLAFRRDGDGRWIQEYTASEPRLAVVRNGPVPPFDLADGPLAAAVLTEEGAHCTELRLAVHHLIIDGVSWQILLDDLAAAYAGTEDAPRHGMPFATLARTVPAPPPPPIGPAGPERDAVTDVRALSAGETSRLLDEAGTGYRMRTDEVLLTALALAFPSGPLRVDVEGHGRDHADAGGTVGWFTRFTPVLLDLAASRDPAAALVAVKERLRAPGEPEGAAEIVFNYLGRLDGVGGGLLRIADGEDGRDRAPGNRRPYPLEIDCRVHRGRFEIAWTRDRSGDPGAADRFAAALRDLLAHRAPDEVYTPSDFPLAELTDESLARVLRLFRDAQPSTGEQERDPR
ncbi:hybrid non-ribosomal peptide synthetase/type I polyketide synthase [Actinocorallia populi]|uniref:hybrid non-ribosomal peptide synthetase/type I polyketide synthase n=1 Tax=Actinocorallia populi TaxID=2079200 RepID=UPI000D089CD1|nr:hybrid non-ribosomal peptide synthetase/type I polyketide synthase [Actinocorallia populi]